MAIEGETFDDVLRKAIAWILKDGHSIRPRKGNATEVLGACLRLENPRARFSRSENRGVLYSALGDTLWYLSGSDEFEVIEHYVPHYRDRCDTPAGIKHSEAAYGPRLKRQMKFIKTAIRNNDTRRAVVAIYSEADHNNLYDVPCTCALQFFPRSGALHAMAQMRSNDVYTGLAHDIFFFTLLQEFLARSAGLDVGTYIHQVGSLHLYDDDRDKAERYSAGGITDTVPMDPMPAGDPQPGLEWLLAAEKLIRSGVPVQSPGSIAPYWQDLARLLQVRRFREAKDRTGLSATMNAMHSSAFRTYIQDELGKA